MRASAWPTTRGRKAGFELASSFALRRHEAERAAACATGRSKETKMRTCSRACGLGLIVKSEAPQNLSSSCARPWTATTKPYQISIENMTHRAAQSALSRRTGLPCRATSSSLSRGHRTMALQKETKPSTNYLPHCKQCKGWQGDLGPGWTDFLYAHKLTLARAASVKRAAVKVYYIDGCHGRHGVAHSVMSHVLQLSLTVAIKHVTPSLVTSTFLAQVQYAKYTSPAPGQD